jgi:hypothetical protein
VKAEALHAPPFELQSIQRMQHRLGCSPQHPGSMQHANPFCLIAFQWHATQQITLCSRELP